MRRKGIWDHLRLGVALSALLAIASPAVAQISINYTFTNGTRADADQVNDNLSRVSSQALNRTGGTMTGSLNTLAVLPTVDDTYSLGTGSFRYKNASFSGAVVTGSVADATGTLGTVRTDLATLSAALSGVARNVVGGRLTLESGVAVSSTDQTAKTTLYYTIYASNQIGLYDGTNWSAIAFPELSISVAGCTASRPYDVFIYNNAGTATMEILAWSSATARSTALTTQDGVLVKTGAVTRRYVGNFYCDASGGQTDDTLRLAYIWNFYNPVVRAVAAIDATGSWTYSTDQVWRQSRASATNQVEVMVGLVRDTMYLTATSLAVGTVNPTYATTGIGIDSSTVSSAQSFSSIDTYTLGTPNGFGYARLAKAVPIGFHTYRWLEYVYNPNAGTVTWTGTTAFPPIGTAGLVGEVER